MITFLLVVACQTGFTDPSRELGVAVPDGDRHPTSIHQPLTLGVADTTRTDVNGTPIGVACATCHGPTPERSFAARDGAPIHDGMVLSHGKLTCDACHDADRTKLHLADRTQLELADAMVLCSQCHGPQRRDYDHGAHGGMTGYWDTRRGPRDRNNCVDCHAAHTPAYEAVLPAFPPKDRRPLAGAAHAEE